VLIIPSSWCSQLVGDLYINTVRIKLFSGAVAGERRRIISLVNWAPSSCFLAPLPGRKKISQGEFHTHILYFVYCFALLYFYLHRFIKNTKKLVSY
jgi:hypothetical protein